MSVNKSLFIQKILIPIREIFDIELKNKDLKIPDHFDLVLDCYVLAHYLCYVPKIHPPGFYDPKTENEMIDFVFNSNIQKIRNADINYTSVLFRYPFVLDEFLIDLIIEDYKKISYDEYFTKELMKVMIYEFIEEIKEVNTSYRLYFEGKGKIKLPIKSFVSCLIHPINLIKNKDFIYYTFTEEIDTYCDDIFSNFNTNIINFLNTFMNDVSNK